MPSLREITSTPILAAMALKEGSLKLEKEVCFIPSGFCTSRFWTSLSCWAFSIMVLLSPATLALVLVAWTGPHLGRCFSLGRAGKSEFYFESKLSGSLVVSTSASWSSCRSTEPSNSIRSSSSRSSISLRRLNPSVSSSTEFKIFFPGCWVEECMENQGGVSWGLKWV